MARDSEDALDLVMGRRVVLLLGAWNLGVVGDGRRQKDGTSFETPRGMIGSKPPSAAPCLHLHTARDPAAFVLPTVGDDVRGAPVDPVEVDLVAAIMHGRHRRARAQRLLADLGGVQRLVECSERELSTRAGVGRASAASLAASVALARRWHRDLHDGRRPLRAPGDVAAMVRSHLLGATQEHFLVIGVTARHRVCMVHEAARGSLSHVDVHPREVFRRAVREGVYAVILGHNHPSGDPSPSAADLELTGRMVQVGRLLGIPVLDHVIIGASGYMSLAAENLMEPMSLHAHMPSASPDLRA